MLRSVLVGVVLSIGAAAVADAQQHQRGGLWGGFGLGIGSAAGTCSVCANRTTGPTAHVRVGGTISQRFLVGVQGTGWLNSHAASDRSLLMLSAIGTWYLWADRGFYLVAGMGAYRYVEADTASELSTQGLALQVGAGFDLRITRGVSLSPFAALVLSGSGNPTRFDKSSGQRLPLLSDMTVQSFQFGVAGTLH